MSSPEGLLIAHEWVRTDRTYPVVNPYTGEKIATVPLGGVEGIDAAVHAARNAFAATRSAAPHVRADLLLRVADGIRKRDREFADTIVAESGKPVAFAEVEVQRAVATFTAAAEEARRDPGEMLGLDGYSQGAGHFGFTRRFPIGVIAAVTPFNFPLNLVAHKVAPCIATGNTMVLKPAPRTPLTAFLLGEVLMSSGLLPGQVNIVTCTNEDAAKLTQHIDVRMISFTGSASVGWQIKAASGKKRVALELGGNAAVVVHEDSDLQAAIPAIAMGAFGAAGQSCISVQRIIVHAAVYDAFRAGFLAYVSKEIHTGDPRDPRTVIGPLISPEAMDRVRAQIARATAGGAQVLLGGGADGPCLEATVIEDADPTSEICQEELFAPVVTLHRYETFEGALALVNASRYGLQAGVFTRDVHLAFRAFEELEVGAVLINQVPTWRADHMPYGGIKDSGLGREGVRYAMSEMTEPRAFVLRRT